MAQIEAYSILIGIIFSWNYLIDPGPFLLNGAFGFKVSVW
jgi:hypothetical protein